MKASTGMSDQERMQALESDCRRNSTPLIAEEARTGDVTAKGHNARFFFLLRFNLLASSGNGHFFCLPFSVAPAFSPQLPR